MDSVALITGASRGIGRAIALRLAQDGIAVVVNFASDEAAASETIAAIELAGGTAIGVQGDVTDLAVNRRLFDAVLDRFGQLDILVNNAGVGINGLFSEIDEERYDRLFAITKASYFAMQNAMRVMQNYGRIINISSGLTRNWAIRSGAYAGSKAAIEQFTRSLSKEAGARGITVNAVLPGVTRTSILDIYPPSHLEASRQQTSFGRLGEPEDIADVVAFLASERARWITGQLIVANGGSTP